MLCNRQSLKWAVTAVGVVAAMMLASAAAQADIINVPGDFNTIQDAIADPGTVDGDEIVVAPGTYNETINFLGKAITLRSSDGQEVTIIDAQGSGSVLTCASGEGPDAVCTHVAPVRHTQVRCFSDQRPLMLVLVENS